MDLLSDAEVSSLEHLLHSINAEATIFPTTRSHLDLKKILDIAAYDSSGPGPFSKEKHHIHNHNHDHTAADCDQCETQPALHHSDNISTVAIHSQEILVKEK